MKPKSLDLKNKKIRHAVHEVGHAIMAMHLGKRVTRIHIHSKKRKSGITDGGCIYDQRYKSTAIERILVSLSGIASCELYGDEEPGDGGDYDMDDMVKDARRKWGKMDYDTAIKIIQEFLYDDALYILKRYMLEIRTLTLELAEKEELEYSDIIRVLKRCAKSHNSN